MNLLGYMVAQVLALLMMGGLVVVERRYPAGPSASALKSLPNLKIYALGVLLGPLYACLFAVCACHIRPIFDLSVIKAAFHGI